MQQFACGSYEPIAFLDEDGDFVCFDCTSEEERKTFDLIGMDCSMDYKPECVKCGKPINVEVL
ncbi:MAG: hypothetical protein ACOCQR_03685 [bacterium]